MMDPWTGTDPIPWSMVTEVASGQDQERVADPPTKMLSELELRETGIRL